MGQRGHLPQGAHHEGLSHHRVEQADGKTQGQSGFVPDKPGLRGNAGDGQHHQACHATTDEQRGHGTPAQRQVLDADHPQRHSPDGHGREPGAQQVPHQVPALDGQLDGQGGQHHLRPLAGSQANGPTHPPAQAGFAIRLAHATHDQFLDEHRVNGQHPGRCQCRGIESDRHQRNRHASSASGPILPGGPRTVNQKIYRSGNGIGRYAAELK
jgi:hypothetical protein